MQILVIEPDLAGGRGTIVCRLPTAGAEYPTSLSFGGPDLTELFVTTATVFNTTGGPLDGSVLMIDNKVTFLQLSNTKLMWNNNGIDFTALFCLDSRSSDAQSESAIHSQGRRR